MFPFGELAMGILLDGWLTGSASATAVLNGRGKADTGDWSPGDSDAARSQIGSAALLGSLGSAAADAASRMTGAYLAAMAVALTSGGGDGQAAGDVATALGNVLADRGTAENAVLNEVVEASADAAEDVYSDFQVSMVDILNGPDPCPICTGLAENNPHLPGLVPAHPHCECAEVPNAEHWTP